MRCGHPQQSLPPIEGDRLQRTWPLPCATCEAKANRLVIPIQDPAGGFGAITFERVVLGGRWIWRRTEAA